MLVLDLETSPEGRTYQPSSHTTNATVLRQSEIFLRVEQRNSTQRKPAVCEYGDKTRDRSQRRLQAPEILDRCRTSHVFSGFKQASL